MHRCDIAAALKQGRVIGIVRTSDAGAAVTLGRALLAAGLPAVEVALTTPDGIDAVRTLASEASEGTLVGAGTVLDGETARAAIRAGAKFLVAPGLAPGMVRAAQRYGVAALPGAATATEVTAALEAGADLVKLFPAASYGIGHLRALHAALPQAPLVPTGGVGPEDAAEWLSAGAAAVGVGGSLTRGGPSQAGTQARRLLEAIRSV